jgi:hypothetical protein
MKEYKILIKDHEFETASLWLNHYKFIKPNQFAINLSENQNNAGCFDEDDYIIDLIKQKFKNVELIEISDKTIPLNPPLKKEEKNEFEICIKNN